MAFLISVVNSALTSVVKNEVNNRLQRQGSDRNSFLNSTLVPIVGSHAKRNWRKYVAVSSVAMVAIGAIKAYLDYEEYLDMQNQSHQVEQLALTVNLIRTEDTNVAETVVRMGDIQDTEAEIEDVLELDPYDSSNKTDKMELEIAREKDKLVQDVLVKIVKEKEYVAKRKRVKSGKEEIALRSLVAKAKLAFPGAPRDVEVQAQSINLFLYKECRKLNLRVTEAARLIPQAVALALVPDDKQIEYHQLSQIPSIQKRRMRRAFLTKNLPLVARVISGIGSFLNK
jgi:hypothetical protein